MDAFKEDIIELRNFKSKHKLKDMVVHFYESNMNKMPYCMYVTDAMEKLIPGSTLSYTIGHDDFETGLFPLVTTNSLYLIELENDGVESLKQIEYYKKRFIEIQNKLASKNFVERAPADIVELENKRLSDFNDRWLKASIGYTFT